LDTVNIIEGNTVKAIKSIFAKQKRQASIKELHKRILTDSLLIKTPKNAQSIDGFKGREFKHVTFILYPITLNKDTKYTQYIHAALSEDHKVTTPLSWETIEFLKTVLSIDLETIHRVGFEQYNNGQSTRPFSQCYSTATIVWNDNK
jgi:hypothetical protein